MLVVHVGTNQVYELNRTAGRIWELLEAGVPEEDLPQRLREEFPEAPAEVDRQIRETLRNLQAIGLLGDGVSPSVLPVDREPRTAGDGWIVRAHPVRGLVLESGSSPATASFAAREDSALFFDGWLFDSSRERDASPAEIALTVHREAMEGLPDRLSGLYSAIAWDGRRRVVRCFRDRIGLRPLFFARSGEDVLVSDSISALVGRPEVSRAVDPVALAGLLAQAWPLTNETCFRSVQRIPPAHVLTLEVGRSDTTRYWDPLPEEEEISWATEEELAGFEPAFEGAVERAMLAQPNAIYLSGGLDSVSVAAIASGDRSSLRLGLALIFPDPAAREIERQESVARRLGLDLVARTFAQALKGRSIAEAACEFSATLAAPLQNIFRPAFSALDEEARALGASGILTGCGGDEWLGVTPYLSADLLSQGRFLELSRLAASFARSYNLSPSQVASMLLWRFGMSPILRRAAKRAFAHVAGSDRKLNAWQSRRHIGGYLAPDPVLRQQLRDRLARQYPPAATRSFYERELRRTLTHPIVWLEMEEFYAAGRLAGHELLHPYWDAGLVSLLARVRPERLYDDRRLKSLIRGVVERRFPGLGFASQKKHVVPDHFQRTLLGDATGMLLRAGTPTLARMGIVDEREVRSFASTVRDHRQIGAATRCWELLNFEAWARANV